jgi:hypothetical protein
VGSVHGHDEKATRHFRVRGAYLMGKQ